MRTYTSTLSLLTVLACTAMPAVTAPLAAQADPAAGDLRPLLGQVLDADGEPIVGAEVHCVLPDEAAPRGVAASHVVVATDARGRFRTKVVPCTRHLLWAIGTDEANRVTCAPAWASSGALVALRLDQPRPACEMQVRGLEPWRALAPFRVRVAVENVELPDYAFALDKDDTCGVPPLPAGRAQFDVIDKNGQPLWTTCRATTARVSVHVPPPQRVPFCAVDERGAPVAGAAVEQQIYADGSTVQGLLCDLPRRELSRRLGVTDADGRLIGEVANSEDLFKSKTYRTWMFSASKAGQKGSYSGLCAGDPFVDGKHIPREGWSEVRFTLPATEPKAGVLRIDAETGAPNQPLMLRLGVRVEHVAGNSWHRYSFRRHVTTDADGCFEVPQLSGRIDEVDVILRGDGPRSLLMADDARRYTPRRALSLHGVRDFKDQDLAFTVGQLPTLRLQLLDETGGPARGVELIFLSTNKHAECHEWTPHATTDSAGRVAVLLEAGSWFVFGRTADRMVQLAVTLSGDERRQLHLTPMAAMRGRVLEEDGAPVAGARLDVHSSRSRGGYGEPLHAIAAKLNWRWLDAVRTDADGSFCCPFLALPGRDYDARFHAGDRRSESFRIEAGNEPVTVLIKK